MNASLPKEDRVAHPDLVDEQAHLDHAYRCLAGMRRRTQSAVAIDDMAAQAVDGEIARWHLQQRLRSLDENVDGLAFGRIDEEGTPPHPGPTWYVGRRHVEDERGEPVVVDWRASVSTPFYRATASDPFGLHRRRRFMMSGRQLDDLFDEVFDDPDSIHAARHGGIPDPLLAELERERTGEMRDIVATIQAEQDVVIRAPLDACLVVQGGPGTGKTAVGLHRAAFLLYEHRELLDQEGVLVIGPNPVFLRYIAQVLPSLGETAVRQTTMQRLLGGRIRGFDSPEAAALKGDARMATVLTRAADRLIKQPVRDLEVSTSWGMVRLRANDITAAMDEVRTRHVPHNVGRNALRTQLVRLGEQAIAERRGEDAAPLGFVEELRTDKVFQRALGTWWPAVSAPSLVRRVLSSPTALRGASDGLLSESEQSLLVRKATKRADDEPWTAADLVLVDEAAALADGARHVYGHIVVDEAQDLTGMELRSLGRRCPRRSMTVLGDLAQATRPGGQRSWEDALAQLGSPEGAEITELDLGYRVPAPIIDFANRLLAEAAPDVRPSRSVRARGEAPSLVTVSGQDGDLAAAVQRVVDEQTARWTSVGVVLPEGVGPVLDRVADGVVVVSPMEAKGLEFDAVVVVEPALVAQSGDDHHAGLRLLYVALTRAVQTLTIVHSLPLPEALRAVT
jgi:DNA helicase IV